MAPSNKYVYFLQITIVYKVNCVCVWTLCLIFPGSSFLWNITRRIIKWFSIMALPSIFSRQHISVPYFENIIYLGGLLLVLSAWSSLFPTPSSSYILPPCLPQTPCSLKYVITWVGDCIYCRWIYTPKNNKNLVLFLRGKLKKKELEMFPKEILIVCCKEMF